VGRVAKINDLFWVWVWAGGAKATGRKKAPVVRPALGWVGVKKMMAQKTRLVARAAFF
jgi:hypothetical protein